MTPKRLACLAALVLASASAACTEDPLVATDQDAAPGVSTPTIEMVFDAALLPAWRDTTYWGFVTPSSAAFKLAADSETLRARLLGRFSTVPDSIFVDTARVAIDSFSSAALRLSLDTARTTLPEGGVEVAVWNLTRGFDADDVTWQRAREGEPWTTPGGDLGTVLALDTVTLEADTLGVQPDTFVLSISVDADSLLSAWRDSDGEPGYAVVAKGEGTVMRVTRVTLIAEAVPEGLDTAITVLRSANPNTFIFDPPTPPPTTRLRLAGLPAARYYFDFQLPDSIGPIELRGATINKAGLEFRPTAAAPPPFPLQRVITGQAVQLLADPFVFGEKTPIGSPLGLPQILDPDSLAAGVIVQYDISSLLRLWSQTPADSLFPLRIGIIAIPESREFGFWEFFSAEDAPGVRPVVRVLFTPNPSFLLP